MIPVMIIGPIVQLLALGYAANMDVNRIPPVLLDEDRTPESRRMADRFFGSGYFALAGSVDAPAEIDPWLVTGRAQIALVLSPHFGADWAAGRAARLQVLTDGTDSSSAVVGLAHASRIVAQAAAERAAPRAGPSGAIELVPRMAYNPDLKSRWFFPPGILAMY